MPEEILKKLQHALQLFHLGAQDGSAAYYQYLVSVGSDVKHVFTDKRLFVIVDRPDLQGPRLSVEAVPVEDSPPFTPSGAFLSTENGAMLFDPQLAVFLTRPTAEGPITKINNQIIFPATAWNSIKPRYIILRKDSLYLVGADMYATEFKHVVPDVADVIFPFPEKPELQKLIASAMTGAFDIRSYINGENHNVALAMKTKEGITVICSLPRYANKQTTADIQITTDQGPVVLTGICGGKFTWKGSSEMEQPEQKPVISTPTMPKLPPAAPKAFANNKPPVVVDPAALLDRANANTQPDLSSVDMNGIETDAIYDNTAAPAPGFTVPESTGTTPVSAVPPLTTPVVPFVETVAVVPVVPPQMATQDSVPLPPAGDPPPPRELTLAEQFQELSDAVQAVADAVPVLVKRVKAFAKAYKTAHKQQDATAKLAESNKTIADLRAENAALRKNLDRIKSALDI